MNVLFTVLLLIFSFTLAGASSPQRSIIVSYPEDTPDSIVDEAKTAIKSSGGLLTHEYKLIKAFAAKAPAKAIEIVQSQGVKYNALIEDDQQVHAYGNSF